MGIKKYKHLCFFFTIFYLLMIIIDTFVFVTENKSADWYRTHFIFYIIALSPLAVVYFFGNSKSTAITFGISTIVVGGILGLINPELSMGPCIFLGIGYWSLIDGFDIHKKYGVHIFWAFISFAYAVAVSYVKAKSIENMYFLNVAKNIILYLVSMPIGALMVSDVAGKWVSGKLKGDENEKDVI